MSDIAAPKPGEPDLVMAQARRELAAVSALVRQVLGEVPDLSGAPPGPAGVADALRAYLRADDEAAGWSPDGSRAHPTGGYVDREVKVGAEVELYHYDEAGRVHRGDGPAVISWDPRSRVVALAWYSHGYGHRADGPAAYRRFGPHAGVPFFQLSPGAALEVDADLDLPDDPARSHARARACTLWTDLIEAGLAPGEAMGWLRLAAAAGGADCGAVRQAGGEVEVALAGADAGVRGDDLVAVATGALPLSWAVAGLRRLVAA